MKKFSKKWNTYFTYSMLPMLFINSEFHILASNQAMQKKTGLEETDLLQMNFTKLLVEDIEDQLVELIHIEQYYSFLMKLHLLNRDADILKVVACVNNFFSLDGAYEESLVVFNPLGNDYHLHNRLLNRLIDPSNMN